MQCELSPLLHVCIDMVNVLCIFKFPDNFAQNDFTQFSIVKSTVAHKGHDVTTLKARTFFIEIALLPIEVSLLRRS